VLFRSPGLLLAAVTERVEVCDALVSRGKLKMSELPPGARIGTSSLRRKAQLLAWRPDLNVVNLRGSIDTRLRKLEAGAADAIVVAFAGLERLARADVVAERLPVETMVPAVGQGALALETRSDDRDALWIANEAHHAGTGFAVRAERAFLAQMEGGCEVPVGALATFAGESHVLLRGVIASEDGKQVVRGAENGPAERPEEIGARLAARLLEAGGGEILAAARANGGEARLEVG
jgi:hydroxymethylbilane synthase